MKVCFFKSAMLPIFLGLFVFANHQQVQGQEKKDYLNLNYILSKLTFTSRISKSTEKINAQLIKEIQKRKVNFILSSEDEKSLRNAGANDLLIKIIRENLSIEVRDSIISEEKIALYKKFVDNYSGNLEQKKIALKAAKEFVKKYEYEVEKDLMDYFKITIPALEKMVNCCIDPINPTTKNYEKFDKAFKTKNWHDLFEFGNEIYKNEPEFIDLTLILASVGFDISVDKSSHKYLDQTLFYAERSIELLEKNKSSKKVYYGGFQYTYQNKEFPDGKANALGYMNYIIGYIKYFHLNQKDEAVPYLQKSLTYKSKSNELLRQLNLPIEINR